MDTNFTAARDFIRLEGRLLERRLFATLYEGAPAGGVAAVLRGYRNEDGGFGHGLEPDKRCPASLPIDVEAALHALVTAGAADDQLVSGACTYLAKVAEQAGSDGAVPLAFPVIEGYPRAAHWTEWTYEPGLNPTAGLVGLLRRLGARHPWIDQAEAWCWDQIEHAELPAEAHALSEVFGFLASTPDRERAEKAAAKVRDDLASASSFRSDPDDEAYGLTPLSIASAADSPWRALFDQKVIDAHLDALQREQEEDGSWPIRWDPPSEAARLEWRGIVTLGALRTLISYGRMTPSA
jgi:hypothetical protein